MARAKRLRAATSSSGQPAGTEAAVSSATWEGPASELAVLVPTYDRSGFLPGLIAALEAQRFPLDRFEVVVVDNGSSDGTFDVLAGAVSRTALRLRAVRVSPNRGPAAARNLAAAIARAPFLVFTDDDCLPQPGWLEEMQRRLAGGADLVQGRTLPVPEELRGAGPWARSVWVTGQTPLFETCNIAYRRRVFEAQGGFPEHNPVLDRRARMPFGEDALLGWQVRAAGGLIDFSPEALVHHRVLPGDYRSWLSERRRLAHFPSLIAHIPGGSAMLWNRIFLSRETAAVDLAVVATVLALLQRRPLYLAGVLPWLAVRWRPARSKTSRPVLLRLAQLGAGDLLSLAALVRGSLRARRPVL